MLGATTMRTSSLNYAEINRSQDGALTDPCTEYTARQAIRRCFSGSVNGLSVLDYGCSIGRASQVFKDNGFRVAGVDVIQERLAQAEKACDSVFLRTDMNQPLPFDRCSFDLFFAAQLIEHLCHCDVRRLLIEAYELLKPGGSIFLSTPNPHYLRMILKKKPMIRASHISCWSIEDLEHALEAASFVNPKHFGNGRMALRIGDSFPCRWIYGGIAVTAVKSLQQSTPAPLYKSA